VSTFPGVKAVVDDRCFIKVVNFSSGNAGADGAFEAGLRSRSPGLKATNDNAALLQWSFPRVQDWMPLSHHKYVGNRPVRRVKQEGKPMEIEQMEATRVARWGKVKPYEQTFIESRLLDQDPASSKEQP
jgi:hypothetical protein